jgi:hypothetical protein
VNENNFSTDFQKKQARMFVKKIGKKQQKEKIMTKISPSQLFAFAVLMRLFTVISSPYRLSGDSLIGMILSTGFQVLLILPIVSIFRYNQNFIDSKTSKIFLSMVTAFLILISAEHLCSFWDTSNSINFPIGSKYIALGLLFSVCIYACQAGLKAMGRVAVLLVGIAGLSLFLLIIGSISSMNLENITSITAADTIFQYAIIDFSQSVELVPMFLLLSYATSKKKSPIRAVENYFITKTILIFVITIVAMSVLGVLAEIVDYPFFSIGAFSHPLGIQRTDAVYITLFTVLCVLSVSLNLFLSASLTAIIFPKFRYAKFTGVLLILVTTTLLGRFDLNLIYVKSLMLLLISVAAPLALYPKKQEVFA